MEFKDSLLEISPQAAAVCSLSQDLNLEYANPAFIDLFSIPSPIAQDFSMLDYLPTLKNCQITAKIQEEGFWRPGLEQDFSNYFPEIGKWLRIIFRYLSAN
ncbi:MAG: hypothetical protein D6B26_05050, partial [Spirochaetaceae bacterium]